VESAGVIVSNADLTLCYDERGLVLDFVIVFILSIVFRSFMRTINISGAKYELPKYVLSEPTNLVQDS
jgi:hypothetical protein